MLLIIQKEQTMYVKKCYELLNDPNWHVWYPIQTLFISVGFPLPCQIYLASMKMEFYALYNKTQSIPFSHGLGVTL